jgi:hypothetical protein
MTVKLTVLEQCSNIARKPCCVEACVQLGDKSVDGLVNEWLEFADRCHGVSRGDGLLDPRMEVLIQGCEQSDSWLSISQLLLYSVERTLQSVSASRHARNDGFEPTFPYPALMP